MRVFFDTNVLVNAYIARGLCAELLEWVLTEPDCELLTGEVNLTEIRQVLRQRRFKVSSRLIAEIESEIRDQTVIAKPKAPTSIPVRDPADRWVLASAINGRADVLVTGDKDLLDVADHSPIEIVTPRQMLNRLLMRSRKT